MSTNPSKYSFAEDNVLEEVRNTNVLNYSCDCQTAAEYRKTFLNGVQMNDSRSSLRVKHMYGLELTYVPLDQIKIQSAIKLFCYLLCYITHIDLIEQ